MVVVVVVVFVVVVVRTQCNACVSVHARAQMQLSFLKGWCQHNSVFARTDRAEPYACSLRAQVPDNQSGIRADTTFSIALALEALDPACDEQVTQDVSSWLGGLI